MSYGRELLKRLRQNRLNWDAVAVLLAGALAPLWSAAALTWVGGLGCLVVVILGVVNLRHELREPALSDDWKVWSILLPIIAIGVFCLSLMVVRN